MKKENDYYYKMLSSRQWAVLVGSKKVGNTLDGITYMDMSLGIVNSIKERNAFISTHGWSKPWSYFFTNAGKCDPYETLRVFTEMMTWLVNVYIRDEGCFAYSYGASTKSRERMYVRYQKQLQRKGYRVIDHITREHGQNIHHVLVFNVNIRKH